MTSALTNPVLYGYFNQVRSLGGEEVEEEEEEEEERDDMVFLQGFRKEFRDIFRKMKDKCFSVREPVEV